MMVRLMLATMLIVIVIVAVARWADHGERYVRQKCADQGGQLVRSDQPEHYLYGTTYTTHCVMP